MKESNTLVTFTRAMFCTVTKKEERAENNYYFKTWFVATEKAISDKDNVVVIEQLPKLTTSHYEQLITEQEINTQLLVVHSSEFAEMDVKEVNLRCTEYEENCIEWTPTEIFICTDWGFDSNENSTFAMFNINDNYLIIFNSQDGFYIPEGDKSGNLQAWSELENAHDLQCLFESKYSANEVAALSNLKLFLDETKQSKASNDYEFSLMPNSDINDLCRVNNPDL